MGIRNLTHFDDLLFRKRSKEILSFDESLWVLLDDMRDTLEKVNGYGCAAVHVRVLRRVVVINDVNGVIELINPIVIEESTETQKVQEGSIAPGAPRGYVIRPKSVTVAAKDRNRNPITVRGEGFLAATLCHEIDHLNGIMFADKLL